MIHEDARKKMMAENNSSDHWQQETRCMKLLNCEIVAFLLLPRKNIRVRQLKRTRKFEL